MGNKLTCCVRANRSSSPSTCPSPSPRVSSILSGSSRQVRSKSESKVHEEAARDTGAVERVPSAPKSEKMRSERLNSLALMGYNRHNISNVSAPVIVQEQDEENNDDFPGRHIKRYKSYPTIFLYHDTVSQPDYSFVLQAVSMAVYNNIKYRIGNRSSDIFDERKHPFKHQLSRKSHLFQDPEPHVVYRFVCDLFSAEHFTAQCAIVTLIYLERIKLYIRSLDVCPTNWKRLLLAAATVAYELWDKEAVWDLPFCQLANNIITFEDMNEIEMHFLSYIQFDTEVSASLYAKYYFDLRYLVQENNPLVLTKSFYTEAISRGYQEKDLYRASIKRSLSVDNINGMQHIKGMLTKENEGF